MNRLLIVDGHAYAYRAFYAIRELRSPEGSPTNAIYGFVKMLAKMRMAQSPTHMMVVWDGGLDAGRMELLPDYKAHRPEMPGALRDQLDGIADYLDAAGIAQYRAEGVEADDYIASLALKASAAGWNVVIASSDKDFMQLVSDSVGLLNPNDKTGDVWRAVRVLEKTGVAPANIVGWLALMGDAVDNIPGVPGVGPKTAAELLNRFGSVHGLLSRLDELKPGKLRSALVEADGLIRKNLELVCLKPIGIDFNPSRYEFRPVKTARLRQLLAGWGFAGMLAELDAHEAVARQAELI